jgi:pilus assembly protein CpaE
MVRQIVPATLHRKWIGFRQAEDGVSAVEFALIAPVFAIALVAMVDVGLALYERMAIDHVLRSGAQAAMSDPDPDHVLKVMQSTISGSFADNPSGISLDMPKRYCACPENPAVDPDSAPDCTVTCADSALPYVYYRMAASKTYRGIFIPGIPLASTVQVQIR